MDDYYAVNSNKLDDDGNIYGEAVSEELYENIINDLKGGIAHGILVSNLTYRLAIELGLTHESAYELKIAGFIHDIGKIKLSPYLYGRNTNGLSIEEMKYMRMHSKLSYNLLKKYQYSNRIMETVLCHHECYDGSGYPDNLVGEEIPLGARILKVTDEFAALISDRPYRKAFDIDTAVDIMIEEVKNMDMGIFIVFQRLVHEKDFAQLIENSKINLDELDISDILDI
jgi:HD-GYP domain-containing protein (c-di-GMP phosphodiesterase class II)